MGRPKKEKVKVPLTVWVDNEDIQRLDKLSESIGLSRSRMAANLLKSGMSDAEVMDAFGVFSLVRRIESGLDKFSQKRAEAMPPAGKRA